MEPFSYEHTFQFDENLYVRLNALFAKKNRPIRLAASGVVGIACLFWAYTFLVGLIILLIVAISLIMPRFLPQTAASNFKKIKYLHQSLTYGVNEKKLWVRGDQVNVELDWKLAVVWDIRENWLRIRFDHAPIIWFKIGALKEAGVYEKVMELCNTHAVKFYS